MALVGLGLATLTAGCFEDDGSLRFKNDTDATVWIGHNFRGDAGFDLGRDGWTEVRADQEEVYSVGGCVGTGELVVASAPEEVSIIDRRIVNGSADDTEGPLCSDWTWSGVGDHE